MTILKSKLQFLIKGVHYTSIVDNLDIIVDKPVVKTKNKINSNKKK
jgi:hypothetical protein